MPDRSFVSHFSMTTQCHTVITQLSTSVCVATNYTNASQNTTVRRSLFIDRITGDAEVLSDHTVRDGPRQCCYFFLVLHEYSFAIDGKKIAANTKRASSYLRPVIVLDITKKEMR